MFSFHLLNDKGKEEVRAFKTLISDACKPALEMMPDGREKAVFKTKVEEAVFFGTKAIAGKDGNSESIEDF